MHGSLDNQSLVLRFAGLSAPFDTSMITRRANNKTQSTCGCILHGYAKWIEGQPTGRAETEAVSIPRMMYTEHYINNNYIYGPRGYTQSYIKDKYIYSHRGYTQFYVSNNYIYGPRGYTNYYISNGYIYGPSKALPWL
jgi:hypothetical protein